MNDHEKDTDYFASMTDMMVGVLFVFVIMIAYFAFQITEQESVPKSVYDAEVAENKRLRGVISELEKEIERLKEIIEKLMKPNPLEVYIQRGTVTRDQIVIDVVNELVRQGVDATSVQKGVVTISGKDMFLSGRSDLESREGALEKIEKIASVIANKSACYSAHQRSGYYVTCNPNRIFIEAIFVEGHTDNDKIVGQSEDGSKTNLELSARRATNTYERMVQFVPSLEEFMNPGGQNVLSAAAYGEQRPAFSNDTKEGKSKNRRIDIRFVMYQPKSEDEMRATVERFGGSVESD